MYGVDGGALVFPGRNCSVTTAHNTILCYTSEGAGSNLGWTLTIGNQTSQSPVTNYG